MFLIELLEHRTLLAAGDLDPAFGTAGAVSLPNDPTIMVPLGGVQVLLLDNDSMERRNVGDFSIDTSFGTQGNVALPEIDQVHDVLVQPDGKILVGGTTRGTAKLLRFNADGTLDTHFGANGIATYPPTGDELRTVIDRLAIQSDGKILFSGYLGTSGAIWRVNADGSIDSTFNEFKFDIQSASNPLQLQSDGKILVGGLFRKAVRSASDRDKFFSLARLNSNGTLDTSFGEGGYILGRFDVVNGRGVPETRGFRVLDDDRILQAGDEGRLGTLRRFTRDGNLDTSFGSNGITTVDFGAPTRYGSAGFDAGQIIVLADGRIVVNASHVARFSADGKYDASFGRLVMASRSVVPLGNSDMLALQGSIFDNGAIIGKVIRLQGSGTTPAGPVQLSGGVATVTGSDQPENIDAFVDQNETDDVVSMVITGGLLNRYGRVYDVSAVQHIDITAGGGRDFVLAQVGTSIHTSASGGDGNDVMVGGLGDESLSGNAGKDDISGGAGNDRLAGNGGRDKIQGNAGNDRLYGGASGDWLAGQDGNDSLYGEGGADRLGGGAGADLLHGNAGDDLITAAGDPGTVDLVFGDGGHDTATRDPGDVLTGIEVVSNTPID